MSNFFDKVRVEALAGSRFSLCFDEAHEMALKLNKTIVFEFNGVDVNVSTNSNADDAWNKLQQEFDKIRESRKTK